MENPYCQYMYSYPHKTAYRPLSGINLKDYGVRLAGKGHSLYLHIPFCQSKCGYCNLFSVTGQGNEEIDRYLNAVERQAIQYRELLAENGTEFSDITVGGGTPLLLSEDQLDRMFSILEMCALSGQDGKPEICTLSGRNRKLEIRALSGRTGKKGRNSEKENAEQTMFFEDAGNGLNTNNSQEADDGLKPDDGQKPDDGLKPDYAQKPDAAPDVIIETAPNQTTREKLQRLKARGVSRVSIGVQSFSDQELSVLGRRHSGKRAREALELLTGFSFSCINIDFIYGIPGQTVDSLLFSLKEGLAFRPDEIFLYPLYVKHGVKMEQKLAEGMVLDPEQAFIQYRQASEFLRSEGYRQDSMRRFVRNKAGGEQGFSKGNPVTGRPFSDCGFSSSLSLGCGGRSYLGNLHFCTPYAVTQKGCLEQIRRFEHTEDYMQIRHGIFLSQEEMRRRYVIKHLSIYPGLSLSRYEERFQTSAKEDFPVLNQWEKDGYLEQVKNGEEVFLALTETGLGLSDYLGPQLISPEIEEKMKEWDRWFCTGVY